MIKNIFLFLLTMLAFFSLEAQEYPLYSKVKISLLGDHTLEDIAELGLECDHGFYAKDRHLINDFSAAEIQILEANGVDFEILVEDVIAWYQERNLEFSPEVSLRDENCLGETVAAPGSQYAIPVNYEFGSMGGYQTYDQMLATLDKMTELYPNLITAKAAIPNYLTHQNRPIYWLAISDNPAENENEPEILYDAVHHAREANSMSQIIFYMWYLLENYETDETVKALVDNTKMYFIPCVNPDGYVYNETISPNGGGMWRKNRKVINADQGLYGVDLNRNYGYGWGSDDNGSSPNPSSDTYRGEGPFSEPETQAVRSFLSDKNIDIAINCHTFSNLLIRPIVEDENDLRTYIDFGELLTRENSYTFGTDAETVGYLVNGDSDSWMYREQVEKPKIFAMTPEVGPENYGFWPPAGAIHPLNRAVMTQNLTAANLLLNYVEVRDNNSSILTNASGTLPLSAKQYGLRPINTTLTIESITEGLTVNFEPRTINIATGNLEDISLPYAIDDQVLTTESIQFVVKLEDGMFSTVDTITKTYLEGTIDNILTDNGNSLELWNTGSWSTTNEAFVSPSTSITDSEGGEYGNNQDNSLTLKETLDLTAVTGARLEYWAKWAIELDYDYVYIQARELGSSSWTSLCGDYTKTDASGNPAYTGTQSSWVAESVDLQDFVGKTIEIRFRLISDTYVTEDGFYLDDFSVETWSELTSVHTENSDLSMIGIQGMPSPFSDNLSVQISIPKPTKEVSLHLVNALGQRLKSKKYNQLLTGRHRFEWETSSLTNGVYFIEYRDGNGLKSIHKIVK